MARVELDGVSKRFSAGRAAVDQIDLVVNDREFLVLVGPSGCGKSTTLRMIAGLEDCSHGQIRIDGVTVNAVAPKDRNIAMVFQNYALYPHMTVYKNMSFGLELRYGGGLISRLLRRLIQPQVAAEQARRRREIQQRVHQAAEVLGIVPLLNRKPHQLSGGERQRVALGRAIVREPAAFLFDEPLSNLDAKLRAEMRVELRRLHNQLKSTVIYVTHDQVEALTLGDRIVVMDQGRIRQIGTPMEVYDRPNDTFVASFIGNPPMSLNHGRLDRTQNQYRFSVGGNDWRFTQDELLPDVNQRLTGRSGQQLTLGVRCEDVLVSPLESADASWLSGRVTTVDQLGDSTILYIDLVAEQPASTQTSEPMSLVARVGARERWQSGDPVGVKPKTDRVHFFDADSGESLLKADNP